MIAELDDLPDKSIGKWIERLQGFYAQEIMRTREEIRGHGLQPPLLGSDVAHLDEGGA